MAKYKNLAEFFEKVENDSIDRAVATLEHIRMKNEEIFIRVEASNISFMDEFMQYAPKTPRQAEFKIALIQGIVKGYKDFWVPKMAPSLNSDKNGITYIQGKNPAVGYSYKWWKKTAKNFWPARKSRLGTKAEYVAFMGVLIKKLVKDANWDIAEAWYAVCDDSENLGVYFNVSASEFTLADTSTFKICEFYDLGNTYKMLDSDDWMDGFFYGGGSCQCTSLTYPLAHIERCGVMPNLLDYTTGWIVLEEDDV